MATEKPRYRTSYTGPNPKRQVIDGKAVVSREELADFKRQFGSDMTLRDLLNMDKDEFALARQAKQNKGVDKAAQTRAERVGQRKAAEDMKRPDGRDAIRQTLGPELGVAAAGRAALGAVASALKRRPKDTPERVEPSLYGEVWRSNRPPREGIPTLKDEVGLAKGGMAKKKKK